MNINSFQFSVQVFWLGQVFNLTSFLKLITSLSWTLMSMEVLQSSMTPPSMIPHARAGPILAFIASQVLFLFGSHRAG